MGQIDQASSASPGKPLLVILGPTAAGKTELACAVADIMNVTLISADSRQVFRKLTIGTAKPDPMVLARYPHECIDIVDPDESYSAGRFADDAGEIIRRCSARDTTPVVVGGSGLYIQALCQGMFRQTNDLDFSKQRARLQERLVQEGIEALYSELKALDPESAARYRDGNPRRILRALEYFHVVGRPISLDHRQQAPRLARTCIYVGVHRDRSELYRRINERSAAMFANGLVEETEALLQSGYAPTLNALNTVGYKECVALLDGSISRERALELTSQKTRNYAKRQLTWFRRNDAITWLEGNPEAIAQKVATMYIAALGDAAEYNH